MNNIIYLVPALGIFGLIVMAIKSAWVTKQDAGDKNMQELAGYIADGAMAFLKAEWKVLSIFVVFAAALLAYSGTIHEIHGKPIHSSWIICIAFIIGAVFSATAGYIGMRVATKANVRTYHTSCSYQFETSIESFFHRRNCNGIRCCWFSSIRSWWIVHRVHANF